MTTAAAGSPGVTVEPNLIATEMLAFPLKNSRITLEMEIQEICHRGKILHSSGNKRESKSLCTNFLKLIFVAVYFPILKLLKVRILEEFFKNF